MFYLFSSIFSFQESSLLCRERLKNTWSRIPSPRPASWAGPRRILFPGHSDWLRLVPRPHKPIRMFPKNVSGVLERLHFFGGCYLKAFELQRAILKLMWKGLV